MYKPANKNHKDYQRASMETASEEKPATATTLESLFSPRNN